MTDFLLLAFIFLIAGVIAVPVASRLGFGSVLGYLIAGIVISPILALLNVDIVSIQHFAEFGVVMMLFLVGLELEPKNLWSMRTKLLGLGGGQVILTTLAVTLVAYLFEQPWTISLAIGLVLGLSSTAIVLQTLNEKGLMKSDGGQSSFSVLLFQDIAVIPMLALIPLLALPELQGASHGEDNHDSGLSLIAGLPGWGATMVTLGAVGSIILVGNFLTRPVLRFIAAANLRELFTATALMMVVGIALLMILVGLSPALGTFVAGVVLANSEYRHELESNIEPFKGLLLGLFFMTVGAGVNFLLLFDNLLLIVGFTIGLMTLKALVLLLLSFVFKIKGSDRWLFALGLAQAGEFGFVLLSFTVANNVLPAAISDQLLLIVALSMLLTPALFIIYDKVVLPRYNTSLQLEDDEIEKDRKIIIAGHGRVGGMVNRMLKATGYSATVIDFSSKQLDLIRTFGLRGYFGDATRPDLLHAAGIDQASVFVVAIDDKEKITELVKYVGKTHPNVHIVARAIDRNHVYDLWAAGCRDIIRETYDSSTRMGRSVFEALGATRDQAEQMRSAFHEMDLKSMLALAEHHNPDVPAHENADYVAMVKEMATAWELELAERVKKILNS